ncbi:hypothetical protein CNMCM8980_001970 [Aspergillus fumigatiaffinis]|nr:hypothetical protein CNMCM8980_001970 [Aspergillus fumigatiaffinis]
MFIPYRGPSKKKDANTRQAINAFVATEASTRRRKRRGEEVEHRGRQGTLRWLQITDRPDSKEPMIDERHQPPENDGQAGKKPSTKALVVPTPVGAGRFYPFGELAPRDFDILLPHDAKALGLGEVGTRSFGRGLLSWASEHDLILHGLTAFTLCSLECQDVTGNTSRAIIFYRNKILLDLHSRLARQQVDDVLIQGMALLILVDDYLGHYEFGPVHLKGVREAVKLRGGFDAVGSSDENAFGRNFRMSLLVTQSMVEFHVQTTITNSPTSIGNGELPYPLPVREETALDLLPGFRDLARNGYLLITAFKGQDAVVNAITSFYVAQQHNSIDAAIAAGVKRYLPSEYGLDNNNPEAQELSPYSGMLQQYLRSKESSGLTWTAIACRMWIGCTTANQIVFTSDFATTQKELVETIERLTGAKWVRKAISTKEAIPALKKAWENGEASAGYGLINICFTKGTYSGHFEPTRHIRNKELGLPEKHLEQVVKEALAEVGHPDFT